MEKELKAGNETVNLSNEVYIEEFRYFYANR